VDKDQRKLLTAGARQLDIELTEQQADQLLEYLALLVKWNNSYNLTAIRDAEKMVTFHLLDSLTLIPFFSAITDSHILDVGTGAGLPGIVLAMMFPQNHFALLDSNGKKTRFLFQAKTQLNLDNVTIHHTRVENLNETNTYQVITSRAYATLRDMVESSQHLLADQGQFFAMKGIYPEQEMKDIPTGFAVDRCERLSLPGDAAERHLVVLSKKTG